MLEINMKKPLHTGQVLWSQGRKVDTVHVGSQTGTLLCVSGCILHTHQNPAGFSGSSGHVSEAGLAYLNVGVFTISWCMKIKITKLWFSKIKQQLPPWVQILWFPQWLVFCVLIFKFFRVQWTLRTVTPFATASEVTGCVRTLPCSFHERASCSPVLLGFQMLSK